MLYTLGVILSFTLFSRMIGTYKIILVENNDIIEVVIFCFMVSWAWPITVPIALSYWHVKKNY